MNIKQLVTTSFFAFVFTALNSLVYAANPESVSVDVEFVDPIAITENNSLSFGLISTALNAETIAIATNDALTDASSLVIGGTQEAADLTVTATASQAITIVVAPDDAATNYTMGSMQCDYDGGGASGGCGGAGLSATSAASATLLIGGTLTGGGGTPTAGVDNDTFTVTISYD